MSFEAWFAIFGGAYGWDWGSPVAILDWMHYNGN